jgi:DNA-binding transcriptional MocR family regulator
LVTDGATQALSLLTQALCRPGDTVLVENPTYLSFLNITRTQGVQAVGVPLDAEGPNLEALERLVLQVRPRFFYTIPTFQNPTGQSATTARRRALLELAARHGFMLVEDDIYARVAYDGAPPATLKSMDAAESVAYVSSFSKTLMPGLRVGYVVAPPALHRRLLDLRRASDLCGPPLLQRAVAEYVRRDGIKRYLRRVLPIYRERRDVLMAALAATMPPGVTWSQPQGGFCCWLSMPAHPIYDDLYAAALRQGWAFAPGSVFQPPGGEAVERAVRICFGQQEPAAIRAGVGVLAQLIRARMEAAGRLNTRVPDWSPLV